MKQQDIQGLSDRRKQALQAYHDGFISLGKLSELVERSQLEMRKWLNEHQIPQNNVFIEDDVKNAE